MPQKWLITDSYVEAVSALEVLAEVLCRVSADAYRWKWAVIALHSAVQGMMVLALQGSHGLHALKEQDAARWLEAHQKGGPYPEDLRLDGFLDLYKKIKSDVMLIYAHSRKFTPQGGQGESLRKLNELRNQFIHFTPQVFALDLSGLPSLCLDCMDIAQFLGWESGNVIWADQRLQERGKDAFEAARKALVSLKQQYEEEVG